MFLVLSCSCLCPIHWSQMLSQEWRCNWSRTTGDTPTTSVWSAISLPNKVHLTLEVWWYYYMRDYSILTTKMEENLSYWSVGWNPFPISNDAAAGGCFTNVSRALQNNLTKIHNTRNHIYGENFKLKLCTCAQSHALGTRTKFQLEILITSTISAIHKFRENISESSWNVSETTP